VKISYLFCLTSLGLSLLAHGQEVDLLKSTELTELPTKADSVNLLNEGNGYDLKIEIPIARSEMTITESYQTETQTAEDIGRD